jgi:hypothetical protein
MLGYLVEFVSCVRSLGLKEESSTDETVWLDMNSVILLKMAFVYFREGSFKTRLQ